MKFKVNVNIGDFAPSSRQMTPKGLLCRDAVLAIAPQVREYAPHELNLKNWGKGMVKVLTPPDVLFSDDVIANLEGGDFTNDHPAGNQVTPENWRNHSIGTAQNVRRDGNKLVGDLLVKDKKAIELIQSNKKVELSLGYSMAAVAESGTTEDGQDYDLVVTQMVGDHIALVKRGRAGSSVRIGDEKGKIMRKITLANGMTFEVEGENLDAFEQGLKAQNDDYQALKEQAGKKVKIGSESFDVYDVEAIQAAFDALTGLKDDLEAEYEEFKQKAITEQDVEKLATERAEVIEKAKNLKPDLEPSGKTVDDIINESVEAHAGDSAVTAILDGVAIGDAKPEQIKTAFKVLLATKPKADKARAAVGDSATAEALKDLNKTKTNALDLLKNAKAEAWKEK